MLHGERGESGAVIDARSTNGVDKWISGPGGGSRRTKRVPATIVTATLNFAAHAEPTMAGA